MNTKLNVINHITCIEQLEKMHQQLAIKETQIVDITIEKENTEKKLNEYKNLLEKNGCNNILQVEDIILKYKTLDKEIDEIYNILNKYELYNKQDLSNFLYKWYNHKCIIDKEHDIKSKYCFSQGCNNIGTWEIGEVLYCLKHFSENEIQEKHNIDVSGLSGESDDSMSKIPNGDKDNMTHGLNKFILIVNKIIFVKRIINCFLDIKNNKNVLHDIDIKKVETKVPKNNIPDKIYNDIINQYYNYEKFYFPICIKNININKDIENINNNINKKDISNAEIIYDMASIYYKYLHENEKKLKFVDFIEYNKDGYEFINISINRIKDKFKRCYDIFHDITKIEKNKIIIILSRCKLNYIKIYKLNDEHRNKVKTFLFEEYNKIVYRIQNKSIDNNSNILTKLENNIVHDILKDIPFSYVGNKNSMINHIISIIKTIKRPVNNFIDLFSGSMVVPYIIRYINKDITISCYENNPYLINFYKYISNNLDEFVKELNYKLNIIKKHHDKDLYMKGILKEIDTFSDEEMGLWYFILINISHCNIISYNSKGISSATFNNKELDRIIKLLDNGNLYKRLKKYSEFIRTIEINNIDITQNYHEIIKYQINSNINSKFRNELIITNYL